MSIAQQLYQLQQVDLELETNEQALRKITSQLGESEAVVSVRNKLTAERQRLEELGRQQRSIEWEIDDITNKLNTTEKELYSGRIGNPKELSNLQHEINGLKARRKQLEDETLAIMDQSELTARNVATIDAELKAKESVWRSQQQQLSADLERVKAIVSTLNQQRQLQANGIDPQTVKVYQELKKQKGTAVAKVEQGICRGCRISLPVSELSLARSGSLTRCGSCGRILFLT